MLENLHFNIHSTQREIYEKFAAIYNIDQLYIPPEGNENIKGAHPKLRVCRFCGKRKPETSFKSKAHVIPKGIFGENYGFSNHECDNCNNFFSVFEHHAGSYLGLARSFNSIGSKKVPKFKSPDDKLWARLTDRFSVENVLEVIDQGTENLIISPDKRTIEIKFTKAPYTPLNVYKCILKIGLSLVSDADISNYKNALSFLMKNQDASHFMQCAQVLITHLDSNVVKPYCVLFKKKLPSDAFPTHVLQLYFSNNMYQIFLPFYGPDFGQTGFPPMTVQFCPPLYGPEIIPSAVSKNRLIDLGSEETITTDESLLTLTLSELETEEIDLPLSEHSEKVIYIRKNKF